jgi:uncharacterized protein DUF3108
MPSKLPRFWKMPAYRRLGLALVLSILLHLWLIKGWGLPYPGWWNEPVANTSTIQAVLLPPVPEPTSVASAKPAPKPAPERVPKPAAKPPAAKKPPMPAALPEPAPEVPEQLAAPPAQPVIAPIKPQEMDKAVEEMPQSQPEAVVQDDSLAAKAPSFVQTDFIVSKDNARGVMQNTYEMQPGGSYILKSQAEAKGFVSLFLGTLKQQSEGVVTDQGLKPYRYTYQYGNNADKLQHAEFDWRAGKLTLQYDKKTKTQPLTAGTQDLLSFMYQFMFVPPLAQMELSITNGKKLDSYTYAFDGEETLSTKMGELRTLHISRTRGDSDEKTELWLAGDYYNLPVKIRQTGKDGSVIEQIATRISTGDGGPAASVQNPDKPPP